MFGKIALSTVFVMSMAAASQAEIVKWSAVMDPAQAKMKDAPTIKALGMAEGTVDTETGMLTFTITHSDLSADPISGAFHGPAAMGMDAPETIILEDAGGWASPIEREVIITPEQAQDLVAGMWYIKLNTEQNRDGEVRGQIETVK
jgi:hypothetical protein